MLTSVEQVIDLIFGRWRSQILARIELEFSKAHVSTRCTRRGSPAIPAASRWGLTLTSELEARKQGDLR